MGIKRKQRIKLSLRKAHARRDEAKFKKLNALI